MKSVNTLLENIYDQYNVISSNQINLILIQGKNNKIKYKNVLKSNLCFVKFTKNYLII